jgi:hypothetical protein
MPNVPGALYKALACFSLRDVDFRYALVTLVYASAFATKSFQQNRVTSNLATIAPVFAIAGEIAGKYSCLLKCIHVGAVHQSHPTHSHTVRQRSTLRLAKVHRRRYSSIPANTPGCMCTRRFRYAFYLDFLSSEYSDAAQNALHHLR